MSSESHNCGNTLHPDSKYFKTKLFFMKRFLQVPYLLIALLITSMGYIVSCTHNDEIVTSSGSNITRGTDVIKATDGWNYDKAHGNVMWETAYIGSGAMLTGRFNYFGLTSFSFDEAIPANTSFEGYVRLNTVNTSEPGRDAGCLLGTFGTTSTLLDEAANIAKIKSKTVTLSTTDKGYIVTMDLTFHGITKEVTGKLTYSGKTSYPAGYAGANAFSLAGFTLQFQFFAKTDFAIVSNNVADKIAITCNAEFKKS
jgi:polyisoprenoid-binding protein YceI